MSDRYQLLPPLSDDEYEALKADIAVNGIRVPVDVDEDGQVLDGHHRSRIAAELGIDCPTRTVADLTEGQKRDHALAVNLARRTLDREQRRALILAELRADWHASDRAIGRRLGCDGKTVASVRREVEEANRAARQAAEEQRRQAADERAAAVAAAVTAARDPHTRDAWAAWVVAHDPAVAKTVSYGQRSLAAAAGVVSRRFGCDLVCEHAPEVEPPPAELPHLPELPTETVGGYRVLPIAQQIPLLHPYRFWQFVEDVRAHGLLLPIVLTADRTTLVDGRIRLLACEAAGVEPTFVTLPEHYTDEDLLDYWMRFNVTWNNKTSDQVAAGVAILHDPAALAEVAALAGNPLEAFLAEKGADDE